MKKEFLEAKDSRRAEAGQSGSRAETRGREEKAGTHTDKRKRRISWWRIFEVKGKRQGAEREIC